jgi:hypothetical protein
MNARMAEIPQTLKKLREARFFLALMKNTAKLTNFEREDFEFYLNAFLSAGRSVTFCLSSDLGGTKYTNLGLKYGAAS